MKNIKTLVSAICLAAVASFAQSQSPVFPSDPNLVQFGIEYQELDDQGQRTDQYTVVKGYICGLAYDIVGGAYPSIVNFVVSNTAGHCEEAYQVRSRANDENIDNPLRVLMYEDNANNIDALGVVLTASMLQEAFQKGYPVNVIYKKDPHGTYKNVATGSRPVFLKAISAWNSNP